MPENTNVALVRHGYECFAKGDVERVHELFADYAVWHQPGRGRFAGDYKGPEEILGLFRAMHERCGGTLQVEPVEFAANPSRVIVIHRLTARRGDDELDIIDAVDFECHANHITEATVFQSDTCRFDEFWD